MSEISKAFIEECRSLLTTDFLPKIERCLEKLTDEAVWWRPNSGSNSIGNLLLHLSGNVRQWIVCGITGAVSHRNRQQEFDERSIISRAALLATLKNTIQEADEVLAQLDPGSLHEKHLIQGREVTLLHAILHVVEHFSMHTGQIILLTKMVHAEDLKFYEMSGDKPIPRWHSGKSKI
ncbi:MAG TPA: DinB family protein [Terriglobia bacterium]|nr:DinB family protein [Terriglobia bacterium]